MINNEFYSLNNTNPNLNNFNNTSPNIQLINMNY